MPREERGKQDQDGGGGFLPELELRQEPELVRMRAIKTFPHSYLLLGVDKISRFNCGRLGTIMYFASKYYL